MRKKRSGLEMAVPAVSVVPQAFQEAPPSVKRLSVGANAEETRGITIPTTRAKDGRWLPGTSSPNPAGRPPGVPLEISELARHHTEAAISKLVEIMNNPRASPAVQAQAAQALLDRGHGRPTTTVDARVASVDVTKLHLQALMDLSNARDQSTRDRQL